MYYSLSRVELSEQTVIRAGHSRGKAQTAGNRDGLLQLRDLHREHLRELKHAGSAAVGYKHGVQQALQGVGLALISLTVFVAHKPLQIAMQPQLTV